MQWLLAGIVVAPVVYLVVGAVRGRVEVRACCPDRAHDKRLAGAFESDARAVDEARDPDVTSRRGSS